MQRSARRPETGNDHHRQLTRLEQSGSGYELHLILSLATNRAASVLGRDLASYRLRRGPIVHVLSSACGLCRHCNGVSPVAIEVEDGRDGRTVQAAATGHDAGGNGTCAPRATTKFSRAFRHHLASASGRPPKIGVD
jgi:hypothetical protein